MSGMHVASNVREASVEVTVFRCGQYSLCGLPGHVRPCVRCRVERLGIVSYYHRSPIKRLLWQIRRLIKWQQS